MATAAEAKPRTKKAATKSASASLSPTAGGNLVGKIAQVIGAVVDVSFEGELPLQDRYRLGGRGSRSYRTACHFRFIPLTIPVDSQRTFPPPSRTRIRAPSLPRSPDRTSTPRLAARERSCGDRE